jgi:hypothetical protein
MTKNNSGTKRQYKKKTDNKTDLNNLPNIIDKIEVKNNNIESINEGLKKINIDISSEIVVNHTEEVVTEHVENNPEEVIAEHFDNTEEVVNESVDNTEEVVNETVGNNTEEVVNEYVNNNIDEVLDEYVENNTEGLVNESFENYSEDILFEAVYSEDILSNHMLDENNLSDTFISEIKEELEINFNKSIENIKETEYILNDTELINILSENSNISLKYNYDDLKKNFSLFNDSVILIQILDGNIKFIEKKSIDSRNQSVIDLLINANNYKKLHNSQFLIYTGDESLRDNDSVVFFSKNINRINYLFPNFNFNNWYEGKVGNYNDIYNYFSDNKIEWMLKEDIIFWNGINTNNIIKKIYDETIENKKYLIELIENNKNSKYYKIQNYSKYKYLINIDGNSSPSYLNYLFLTGSCVIILKNKNNFKEEYYNNNFIPYEDYLEIFYNEDDDTNDIIDRIELYINTYNCEKIAESCFNKAKEVFNVNNIYEYIYNLSNILSKNSDMNNYLENIVMYTPSLDNYYKDRLNIKNNKIVFDFIGDGCQIKLIDQNNFILIDIMNNNVSIYLNELSVYNKYVPYVFNKTTNQRYELFIDKKQFNFLINKMKIVNLNLPLDNFIISNSEIKTLNGGWWLY